VNFGLHPAPRPTALPACNHASRLARLRCLAGIWIAGCNVYDGTLLDQSQRRNGNIVGTKSATPPNSGSNAGATGGVLTDERCSRIGDITACTCTETGTQGARVCAADPREPDGGLFSVCQLCAAANDMPTRNTLDAGANGSMDRDAVGTAAANGGVAGDTPDRSAVGAATGGRAGSDSNAGGRAGGSVATAGSGGRSNLGGAAAAGASGKAGSGGAASLGGAGSSGASGGTGGMAGERPASMAGTGGAAGAHVMCSTACTPASCAAPLTPCCRPFDNSCGCTMFGSLCL